MKKDKKALWLLLWGGAMQWIANTYIFKKAIESKRHVEEPQSFYKWRHGKIHYTVSGKGKPLLLLHDISIGASGHEWYKNVNALAKDYTVYTLDLVGFGYSDKPKTTYTAYFQTKLINDFIEEVIKEPVYIAASNNTSVFSVMSYCFRPDWIKKMLLITPAGISDAMATANGHYLKMLLESAGIGTSIYNFLASRVSITRNLREHAFYDGSKIEEQQIKNYHYFAHSGGKSARYAIASFLTNYMNVDIKKSLQSVQIPVCIVANNGGVLHSVGMNTNIKITAIENTKKLPHVENPRGFYSLCKSFF